MILYREHRDDAADNSSTEKYHNGEKNWAKLFRIIFRVHVANKKNSQRDGMNGIWDGEIKKKNLLSIGPRKGIYSRKGRPAPVQ